MTFCIVLLKYWGYFFTISVLYAPGLRSREQIRAVVDAVKPKPVNAIMGLAGAKFSLRELEDLGVRRVSVGSSLARAAYGAFLRAAKEIAEQGTFDYADDAVPFATMNAMFQRQVRFG